MTDNVSRRSLVKGASWAAPVVVSTALVPAYAASMCGEPGVRFSGGPYYNFGAVGSASTTQRLSVGGQTWVDNLPVGVTVTSIDYVFWIQNRIGQDSYGPGAFYVKNGTSNRATQNISAMPWTPTAGSGFASTVSSTSNLVDHTFSDGYTGPSWDLRMTWTAGANRLNSYTSTTIGCQTFDSGPSGRFEVVYSGVKGIPALTDSNAYVRADSHITIRLSNGTVLQYESRTAIVRPN